MIVGIIQERVKFVPRGLCFFETVLAKKEE